MSDDAAKAAEAAKAQPPVGEASKNTFTAEEVERMKANWSENISRHEEKAAKAAKELESLKAKAAKEAEERKLAEMSEIERAKAAVAERDQQITALREQQKQSAISAEVKLIGLREGANDVGDLLAFVGRESLEIGEDGAVKGVEEAVKTLKEKKPYLFKQQNTEPNKPAGQHPPNTASPRKDGAPVADQAALTAERIRRNAVARGMATVS